MRRRRRVRERQEKGEDWRPILKKLCCSSAVVQGAARRKNRLCEGSTRSNWDPWEGQHPF